MVSSPLDFGFITVEENEERIFVHANSVLTFLPTIVCVLHEGDKVGCLLGILVELAEVDSLFVLRSSSTSSRE